MLGVDADDDVQAARQLGRETLSALPFILSDPAPEVRIDEVGDSNVALRFLGWIDQREAAWFKARSNAIAAVKTALEEAGFAMPEPIYRLRFDQRTGPLPLSNMEEQALILPDAGAKAKTEKASEPSTPARSEDVAVLHDHDVAPEDEVARMVDEERSKDKQDEDLLDANRPVE